MPEEILRGGGEGKPGGGPEGEDLEAAGGSGLPEPPRQHPPLLLPQPPQPQPHGPQSGAHQHGALLLAREGPGRRGGEKWRDVECGGGRDFRAD